ncbi:hypothetical protein THTE_1362 [Thermogutta terrifontis]|uniref:Uncharacterized protein n=1 Tax=Thermogutta terrifontis TaxID=1331910 RepID=A0A286RDC6_9BACT|nr:hypothetical protein THTE_1362 [Thermogutta terrifontis]
MAEGEKASRVSPSNRNDAIIKIGFVKRSPSPGLKRFLNVLTCFVPRTRSLHHETP